MSASKVELGRHLFHDRRLSANGTQSCSSCHRQELAFTDGLPHALGSTGQLHRRSAMTLTNVGYNVVLTWADPGVRRLEEQALIPMLGEQPVELGLKGGERALCARLAVDPLYAALFRAAFPNATTPITFANIRKAIACFERTLVSGNSPYDRLVYQGQMDALSPPAWRGMRLFFSDRTACSHCHAGINFSGPISYDGLERTEQPEFHNTALFNSDGNGGYPPSDTGLMSITRRRRDMGRFRAPTLRNIALTAPYMHDGSIPTLEAVLDHYAAGGRAGEHSIRKSALLHGFPLSEGERRDLVEFLRSLTDESFVSDRRFADPWTDGTR
jgi:cytochrome c peroxidase